MKNLIMVLLILPFLGFSQEPERVVLGYACGYGGSETPVVIKFADLLYEKKYKAIKAFLYSKVPAENFLAYVICKRLEHTKEIKLSEKDSIRIAELYRSKETVPMCAGCTGGGEPKLSEMLQSKRDLFMAMDYYFGER